jgi:hypothetical protein
VTGSLGLAIEGTVALLLVITIGYCILLNRKLGALRRDEGAMRELVRELTEATATAERAIQSLKTSAADWDRALGSRMRHAERVNEQLGGHVHKAEPLIAELSDVVESAMRESNRLVRLVAKSDTPPPVQRQPIASPEERAAAVRHRSVDEDAKPAVARSPRAIEPAIADGVSDGMAAAAVETARDGALSSELEGRIQAQMRKARAPKQPPPRTPAGFDNDERLRDDILDGGTVAERRARLRRNLERRAAG